jgi:DNA-binding transcriptional ArsR family regulator
MIQKGGEISPLELAASLSEPLSALSYHVRVLAECKAVKLVRTERVRGSTQHFYRPAVRSKWARSALARTRDPAKKTGRGGKRKADQALI